MGWETLVPVGAFLAMALAVWGGLTAVAERQSHASDRLDRWLKGAPRRTDNSSPLRQQNRLQAMVTRAAPALSKPLQPNNAAEVGKLRLAMLNAGFRGEQAVQVY